MNLIKKLKEDNEDYEFYPTTDEIIKCLFSDIKKRFRYESYISILDIGAGNGKVLEKLEEMGRGDGERFYFKKYAIEKSLTLIDQMNDSVFIIGTDFHSQNLIDKKMDIIFCNPPYSEYSSWVKKIIVESNSKTIYLVIPQRWRNNKEIKEGVEKRGVEIDIIGSFDFLSSEDRAARAKVDLLRIKMDKVSYGNKMEKDPFCMWFNDIFNFSVEKDSLTDYQKEKSEKERLKIVKKEGLIKELVSLYDSDMEFLLKNYRKIEDLDFHLLKELNVDIRSLIESLRLRIKGLKSLYWEELFNNFSKITDRLTHKSRGKVLSVLLENTSVDFTEKNILAIVIWVVKNANKYFDNQILDLYFSFSDRENIIRYKSNKKIIEDGWRYIKGEQDKYFLDYRIITNGYGLLEKSWTGEVTGLSKRGYDFLNDIFIVARNLSIEVEIFSSENYDWQYGTGYEFFCVNQHKIFMSMRIYKKGTVHLKFSKEFMKRLNVEAARLNGWIRSPEEASKEIDVSAEEAEKFYDKGFKFNKNEIKMLL